MEWDGWKTILSAAYIIIVLPFIYLFKEVRRLNTSHADHKEKVANEYIPRAEAETLVAAEERRRTEQYDKIEKALERIEKKVDYRNGGGV